jgi:hypothetical protein
MDALVAYIRAREAVRVAKESGAPQPWTDDAILRTYRFTNVMREDDRTTRWVRANWTGPHADRPAGEMVFNCGLFRYFGDVEFMREVGWQTRWGDEEVARVVGTNLLRPVAMTLSNLGKILANGKLKL